MFDHHTSIVVSVDNQLRCTVGIDANLFTGNNFSFTLCKNNSYLNHSRNPTKYSSPLVKLM